MQIDRKDAITMTRPPEGNFTGQVEIRGYCRREGQSCLAGATVRFAPGARTPWKVNPLGQTLIITSGTGWVQSEGEKVTEVHAGDVVWFAPGERHWEGATPDQTMTYFAIQDEAAGGMAFGEAVTDREYESGRVGHSI
jgi:quercetin dioxygenase-like cupin family protein